MKLRVSFVLIIALACLCSSVFAEDQKAPIDISVFPGAETSMEINMSNDEIMPTLQAMLPLAASSLGDKAQKINYEELSSAFADVSQIQALQLRIDKKGISQETIAKYYFNRLPKGNWNKLYYQQVPYKSILTIFAQPNMEEMYFYKINTIKEGKKKIQRVEVGKIVGKIDFTKLLLTLSEVAK